MSRMRAKISASIVLLMAFALSACSDLPRTPLRIGLDAWPGFALLFVAQEKGFFEDEGVDVELVELSSLADIRRAFERGQIDGMATSLIEVLEASHNGPRHPIIKLMTDYSNGGDVILANKDVANLASLKGRRVGVESGTLNRFVLARAMEKVGLSIDDVEIVSIPQQAMCDSVVMGEVDAVVTYPPVSVEIVRAGLMRSVFTSAEIPGEVADVVSFDSEIVEHRSADIDAFVRAWGRVVQFVDDHPTEAYELVSKHIGMSVEELASTYVGIEVISAERQAMYVGSNGPLAENVLSLSEILWPDEPYRTTEWAQSFFPEQNVLAWRGSE